jgi:NADP-reducing hydrogenase subunit HndD
MNNECTLTINGKNVSVPRGATILDAAKKVGVSIPTLCHLEHRQPLGACRLCLVEVHGAKTLVTACSTPVGDGMEVATNSSKVRSARKMVMELLLSEHVGDCQYCERGEDCELQELARRFGVETPHWLGEQPEAVMDDSTPAIIRDSGKCIKCRRCVTACGEIQGIGALYPQGRGYATVIGPAFAQPLDTVTCVQCGQCAAVCPTGAIVETSHIPQVWQALDNPDLHVIVQTAPAIRAALGEPFGLPPGTLVTGKMVTALRELGFDAVFDTDFTADLTIMEEGTELLTRLKHALTGGSSSGHNADHTPGPLPMFTSCSPGWIKYTEHYFPEFLDNLSSCKSPQQMFGALAKTYYAEQAGIDPSKIVVVSVMPCTAKKYEAGRPEMNSSGFVDVDYVLTTRELARLIKQGGIDFVSLPDGTMDAPLGISTGAADIFANTGGVMEAALRTAWELVTGRPLPAENMHVKEVAGLTGIKEASIQVTDPVEAWSFLEGAELKVAVAHGLTNAGALLSEIRDGKRNYHFVEIMTCPGGCIGGGGQPRFTDDSVRMARIDAIYREDEGRELRASHLNPAVQQLYKDFLGEPLGEKSHKLLHTHYQKRPVL